MKKLYSARAFLAFCMVTVWSLCSGSAMAQDRETVFLETFGTSASNTALGSYSGWSATSSMFVEGDASENYSTCSSNPAKVSKNTEATYGSDYDDASGVSCLFRAASSGSSTTVIFTVENINIAEYSDLVLSYAAKASNGAWGTTNKLEVKCYVDDLLVDLTEGKETAPTSKKWYVCSGSLSSGSKLKLEFVQTVTGGYTIYLDDIKITGVKDSNPNKVNMPVFSINGTKMTADEMEVAKGTAVTLSADNGAMIYYTINDGDIEEYQNEIILTEDCIIEAYASKKGEDGEEITSDVVSKLFTIKDETPTPPVFKYANGEDLTSYAVQKGAEIVIGADGDCVIFYTTDGTEPTPGSTLYTEGTKIVVSKACTVKAIAVRTIYNGEKLQSAVASADFTIVKAASSYVYKKITSADELVDGGVYVIVYEGGSLAMPEPKTSASTLDGTTVSFNGGVMESTSGVGEYVLCVNSDGTYSLKFGEGKYLAVSGSSSTSLAQSTSVANASKWNITLGEAGAAKLVSMGGGSRQILYNTSSNTKKFGNYASSNVTGTGYNVPVLYRKVEAEPLVFAEAAEGWGTFFTDDVYEMPAGVTGYAVSVTEEDGAPALTMTRVYEAGEAVPVGTPLLLRSQTVGSAVYVPVLSKTATASAAYEAAGNQLRGLLEAGEVPAEEGNNYYYKLTTKDGANIGFYWGVEGGGVFELKNDKRAYLVVPQTTAAAMTQGFRLGGGTTTGIDAVQTAAEGCATVYTLSGVRLNTTPDRLPAGLYIVNGKKVLVK